MLLLVSYRKRKMNWIITWMTLIVAALGWGMEDQNSNPHMPLNLTWLILGPE